MSNIHLKYDSTSPLINNSIIKFLSGTTASTSSQIYDTGTNVGIGVSNPTSKLHVEGNMVVSGTSATNVRVKIGDGTAHLGEIYGANISAVSDSGNGRVEIATGQVAGTSALNLSTSQTSYGTIAKFGPSYAGSVDGIPYAGALYIANTSFSAEGTLLSPNQHHYFIGPSYADTYIGDYGIRHSSKSTIGSGPNGEIQFYKAAGSSDGNGFSRRTMVIGDYTSVGGSSSIGDMLSIENNAVYTASTTQYRQGAVVHINDNTPYTATTGNIFKITKAGTEVLSLTASGNLGIGTSTPTAVLDITGATGYNQLRLRASYTPSSSGDTNGNIGDIAWDNNYVYVKTNTGWGRSTLDYSF
jgi:hypothetical protein